MQPRKPTRRGMALMLALLVAVAASTIVIATLDATTLQFAAGRNTIAWERARYLAEAGAQHALAELEADFSWRTGIPSTEFPAGSGCTYSVTAADGASGTVVVNSTGSAGGFTRRIETTIAEN